MEQRKKLSHSKEIVQLPLWEYAQPMYPRKFEVKAKIDHMYTHMQTYWDVLYKVVFNNDPTQKRDQLEDLFRTNTDTFCSTKKTQQRERRNQRIVLQLLKLSFSLPSLFIKHRKGAMSCYLTKNRD